MNPPGGATFSFGYNNDAIPHLTSIANAINSQDSFYFTYNSSVVLASPFGSSGKSFGTAGLLSSAKNNATNLTTGFTYDTGNSGELQEVTFPLGGTSAGNTPTPPIHRPRSAKWRTAICCGTRRSANGRTR